jgi:hypothetical protein
MANTNAPFGFRQYSGNGSAPTYEQVAATIVSTNTTPIFYGDPVEPDADGYIVQGDGTTAAAGIAGVFVGCKYLNTSMKRTVWSNYWPGSGNTGDVEAYIVNDPNAKFVVQSDATGLTQAAINSGIGYTIGTGNTSTGISGAYVSTLTTATTAPFRVVGLVTAPPGAPGTESGAYNQVIVAFNNVTTRNLTGI